MFDTEITQVFSAVGIGTGDTSGKLLTGNKNQAIRLENISQRLFWRCRCVNYTSGSVATKIVQ